MKLSAQKRIARQRVEVSLPLSKIVNSRKEVFNELKVNSEQKDGRPMLTCLTDVYQLGIAIRCRETTIHDPFLAKFQDGPNNLMDRRAQDVGHAKFERAVGETGPYG